MKNIVSIVVLVVLLAVSAGAQGFDSSLAAFSKAAFGYNGQTGIDCSSPMEYSINPAMIGVTSLLSGSGYAEFDYGSYDFSAGPRVSTNWLYATKALKDNRYMRIGFYATSAKPQLARVTGEGLKIGLDNTVCELAFARVIAPAVYAGVSIAPEVGQGEVTMNGRTLAKGETKLNPNIRVGLAGFIKGVYIGATATYDDFASSTKNFNPTSGEVIGMASGYYKYRLATIGATFNPVQGTYIALNFQKGVLKGPGINENINLRSLALTQYLTPNISVAYSYSDHGSTYSAQYRDKDWSVGTTLGNNVYRKITPYFGTAKSLFVWGGKSF